MWKESPDALGKSSVNHLKRAQEWNFPYYVSMEARLSSRLGIQALLESLKVAECGFEPARYFCEQSQINSNKAITVPGHEKKSAMYSDLAIAYGVQALALYLEHQKRTG